MDKKNLKNQKNLKMKGKKMQVEIRLKKLLKERGLDYFGVISDIAKYCDVNRQNIGRIYRNQVNTVNLKVLNKICDWLEQEQNVPSELLPHALFGRRPARLWEAIGGLRTRLYLGVYQESHPPGRDWKYIAQGDVNVGSKIIQYLTQKRLIQEKLETQYVTFRFNETQEHEVVREYLEDDIEIARKLFDGIKTHKTDTAHIYIGSPIANLLSELLISDLFDSNAFEEAAQRGIKIPFYMLYRSPSHAVISCFGGLEQPVGYRGRNQNNGIFYRDEEDRWQLVKWEEGKREPGIVITVYDPGSKTIKHIVIFGYTGTGTEILGSYLVGDGAIKFWPPVAESRGMRVGVYIYNMSMHESESQGKLNAKTEENNFEVIPLSREILEKYLR